MAHVLQEAPTGRAKCRGCGQTIAKGELRFGESLPNPYGEGDALYWFHPVCGACMRPEAFASVLAENSEKLADRAWLSEVVELGTQHHRLPRIARAERSPSNRARCRHCREVMDKGVWRLALQMFEEGRFSPIGFIHVKCSESYFGTAAILERITRLTPNLTEQDKNELEELLRHGPVAAPEGESEGDPQDMLAKTRPADIGAENAVSRGGSKS